MTRHGPALRVVDGVARRHSVRGGAVGLVAVLLLATACVERPVAGTRHPEPSEVDSAAVSPSAASEHSVIIYVGEPAHPRSFGLDLIEDPLIRALRGTGAGYYDGNFLGPDGAEIYLYGPDADRLHAAIRSALRAAPMPRGSYLVKRYGDIGAREVRVDVR